VNAKLGIWVNKDTYQLFMSFYNFDLAQGTLPFSWIHPIKETPIVYKFLKAPAISTIGPLNWRIDCELEEM
jgi:hypothetical protein